MYITKKEQFYSQQSRHWGCGTVCENLLPVSERWLESWLLPRQSSFPLMHIGSE